MYCDQPVRADSIPYVSRYWHAYGFAGFGDYVGTARDLLRARIPQARPNAIPRKGIREPTVTGDLPEDDGSVSMTGPRPAALGLRISLVRAGPRLQRNKRVVRGEDGREETARPVEGDLLLEPARIR
jgi:hypothetical protein